MSRTPIRASRLLREASTRLGESSRTTLRGSIATATLQSRPISTPSSSHSSLRPTAQGRYTNRIHTSRSATTLATNSSASQLPVLPANPKVRVTPPSLDRIKADGFFDEDVALVAPEKAMIAISPEAVTQLALITSREPPDVLAQGKLALRIMVESGGCHGYQDKLSLTEERNVDDYVFQPEGINCIPVVIDLVSLDLLKGSRLHFATELIGSSFRIDNNPQAKDGGCGCGVSWSLS